MQPLLLTRACDVQYYMLLLFFVVFIDALTFFHVDSACISSNPKSSNENHIRMAAVASLILRVFLPCVR